MPTLTKSPGVKLLTSNVVGYSTTSVEEANWTPLLQSDWRVGCPWPSNAQGHMPQQSQGLMDLPA